MQNAGLKVDPAYIFILKVCAWNIFLPVKNFDG